MVIAIVFCLVYSEEKRVFVSFSFDYKAKYSSKILGSGYFAVDGNLPLESILP